MNGRKRKNNWKEGKTKIKGKDKRERRDRLGVEVRRKVKLRGRKGMDDLIDGRIEINERKKKEKAKRRKEERVWVNDGR